MKDYMQARASAADAARELAQIEIDLRAAIRGKDMDNVNRLHDQYTAAGGQLLLVDIWTDEMEQLTQTPRKGRRS